MIPVHRSYNISSVLHVVRGYLISAQRTTDKVEPNAYENNNNCCRVNGAVVSARPPVVSLSPRVYLGRGLISSSCAARVLHSERLLRTRTHKSITNNFFVMIFSHLSLSLSVLFAQSLVCFTRQIFHTKATEQ